MDKAELRAAAEEYLNYILPAHHPEKRFCSWNLDDSETIRLKRDEVCQSMARHILATVPADADEPVTIDYVVSHWKGLPEDASVEQWHWVTDQVFLRFREDRKWTACTPDSDPESWHEFAVIETIGQLRSLLTGLGIDLKGEVR